MENALTLMGGMAPATPVATASGTAPAGNLAPGDWVRLRGGGGARIAALHWDVAPAVRIAGHLLAADQPILQDDTPLPAAWLPAAEPAGRALLVRLSLDAPDTILAAGAALPPAGPAPIQTLLAAVERLRAARR